MTARKMTNADLRTMIVAHQGWDPGNLDPSGVGRLKHEPDSVLSRLPKPKDWPLDDNGEVKR